ncbi:hypothetical protein PsAD13_03135 [Pseudovibrio sp. Ad13]|nr:hypothetical protein PsAD13_03135 [Pseudovibrio sp. Ad13]
MSPSTLSFRSYLRVLCVPQTEHTTPASPYFPNTGDDALHETLAAATGAR